MPKRSSNQNEVRELSPRMTDEGRENRLVSLAMDLAEKHLLDGTASSAEIVHFLKLGSSRNRLETERDKADIDLKVQKKETMASAQRTEELYANAMAAMAKYSGSSDENV
jgi:hypothetical protein